MPNRTTTTTQHPHPITTTPPPTAALSPLHSNNATQMQRRFPWRLPDFWSKTITARSRRRRRRHDDMSTPTIADEQTASAAAAPASFDHHPNNNSNYTAAARPALSYISAVTNSFSQSATTATAYVALLLLSTTCSLCAASPCESHSWWNPVKDKCIPCTICQGDMIPLRPCQLHRDTICGSIYDLKIDWVVLAKTEPNWKERRKSDDSEYNLEQQFTHEELQQFNEEIIPMDWQTAALFVAVLACLLFFIVAACILIHHIRQWRRMERRLDQDVEELSTKLMAKLAEVQSLEGGTFFIGNADALRVPTTFQPHHVLLPEKPAKHHDRRILKTLQPGNVYIEENGSKG